MVSRLRQDVKGRAIVVPLCRYLVYDMVMTYIRTNIYLTDKQREALKALALIKGIKPAQLTRLAISEYIERQTREGKR